MNETILTAVGNLASDVDHRVTPNGVPVAGFRLACNERRWSRQQEGYSDGDSFFIRVNCWRTLADRINGLLQKGDPVVVRGRIVSRSYDDREGIRRFVTEIEANAVGIDVARVAVDIRRRPRRDTGERDTGEIATGGGVAAVAPADQEAEVTDPWHVADDPIDGPTDDEPDAFLDEPLDALPASGR